MISSSPSPACLGPQGSESAMGRWERGCLLRMGVCPLVRNTSPDGHDAVPLVTHGSGATSHQYLKDEKGVDGVDDLDTGPGTTATRLPLCVGCLGWIDAGSDALPRRQAINTLSAPSTHKPPPAPEAQPENIESNSRRSAGGSDRLTVARECRACDAASRDLPGHRTHSPVAGETTRRYRSIHPQPQRSRSIRYGAGGGGDKKNPNLRRTSSPLSPRRAPVSMERFLLGIHQP